MTKERWQLVEKIYHAALEREGEARTAFLTEACESDEELRREVEALIAQDGQAGSFIESPALEIAAKQMAGDSFSQVPSSAPERIGPYKFLAQLGRGGMGEVYLAEDTRLGRKVAIKFLPPESTADGQAKKRLLREARAAATLDHPNICAVYEVGEDAGRSFIVMQYVDGETLVARLKRHAPDLREALAIATQIADALADAHAHGIIHRDIKPQNIMLTARGQLKVLDFGLAKIARDPSLIDSEVETESLLSAPGLVVGTVPYMSPEQVRGETLDGRSDIFSAGAVFYEVLTGRRAFTAENSAATLSAILTREPLPLMRFVTNAPQELHRIITKALRKDRDERYQTAKDLLLDLKTLKEELEFQAKLDGSAQPAVPSESVSVEPPKITAEQRTHSEPAQLGSERVTPHKASSKASGGGAMTTAATRDTTPKPNRDSVALTAQQTPSQRRVRAISLAIGLVVMVAAAALAYTLVFRGGTATPQPEIKSLAVLPFKSLNPEAKEDYLGLGIATDIITKISQSGELTVRPTSAIHKYVSQEMDALEAAREQKVDAVLDSTFLHVGDQLRVTVNLLRVIDGASLWAEKFDERFTAIFAIQDKVSQQVAQRLRLRLSPAEQARLTKRYTSNPEAYNYYTKAMYHFGNRTIPNLIAYYPLQESDLAIDLFKKAIELDPKYALAHAQLAYAYADTAVFGENNPALIEQAKQELGNAERLDPQLAEVHAARSFIVWSQYEGWQVEAAIRELRLAQQLNPDVGHLELSELYMHIGLEELD